MKRTQCSEMGSVCVLSRDRLQQRNATIPLASWEHVFSSQPVLGDRHAIITQNHPLSAIIKYRICCLTLYSWSVMMLSHASECLLGTCLKAFMLPGGPLLPFNPAIRFVPGRRMHSHSFLDYGKVVA